MRCQQLGGDAVARSDVQHVPGFEQLQQGASERFPGAAGGIMPLHIAGHRIGPPGFPGPLGQHRRQAGGIGTQHGVVDALAQGSEQALHARIELCVGAVISGHASPAVADKPGFLQLGQVRGHAGLGQVQDGGELGHGQFLALEQGQQADAGGVGKQAQHAGGGGEIQGLSFHRDIKMVKARPHPAPRQGALLRCTAPGIGTAVRIAGCAGIGSPRHNAKKQESSMDFRFTDDQLSIQAVARDFAQKRIAPVAAEFDAKGEFPLANIQEMGQLGLMGIEVPEEYGGAGMDTTAYALAVIEVSAADAAHATIMSVNNSLFCNGILKNGTEDQKQKYVRAIASGEEIGAYALTEPQSGSDASNMHSTPAP